MTIGTLYSSMSGMRTYQEGLDVISNNVANLNTPGFKASDLLFRDVYYQYQTLTEQDGSVSSEQRGAGVDGRGTATRFGQGDIQESGNDTDVAIKGNGFFVLRGSDQVFYTRGGQFELSEEGKLVARDGGIPVAAIDSNGRLTDLSLDGLRSSHAKATSEVKFINNLSVGSSKHEITDLEVVDRLGKKHTLKVVFTNNNSATPRSWLIEIKDKDDKIVSAGHEIRFQGNGSPEAEFNQFTFNFTPDGGEAFDIRFNFGDPGTFSNATSFSGGAASDLKAGSKDGNEAGALLKVGFERNGALKLEYSNGQSVQGPRLALAWFKDLESLRQVGGGMFVPLPHQRPTIAAAAEEAMGEVVGKSIEISNVELTQEFTDLIVVQRGFQASSQVLTTANEMIQQLLDLGGGR